MRTRKTTVCSNRRTGSEIRMRGLWLRTAGFEPGMRLSVRVLSPGVIELRDTLKPETENQKAERALIMARLDAAAKTETL